MNDYDDDVAAAKRAAVEKLRWDRWAAAAEQWQRRQEVAERNWPKASVPGGLRRKMEKK